MFHFRIVDAFEGKIESTVEDNISKKIKEGIVKLDSSLQSLPQEIPIADVAVLNVTFVGSPLLSSSSIELKINGLFNPSDKKLVSSYNQGETEDSDYRKSRHENVRNSASHVPFNVSVLVHEDFDFSLRVSFANVLLFSYSIMMMKPKVLFTAMIQLR